MPFSPADLRMLHLALSDAESGTPRQWWHLEIAAQYPADHQPSRRARLLRGMIRRWGAGCTAPLLHALGIPGLEPYRVECWAIAPAPATTPFPAILLTEAVENQHPAHATPDRATAVHGSAFVHRPHDGLDRKPIDRRTGKPGTSPVPVWMNFLRALRSALFCYGMLLGLDLLPPTRQLLLVLLGGASLLWVIWRDATRQATAAAYADTWLIRPADDPLAEDNPGSEDVLGLTGLLVASGEDYPHAQQLAQQWAQQPSRIDAVRLQRLGLATVSRCRPAQWALQAALCWGSGWILVVWPCWWVASRWQGVPVLLSALLIHYVLMALPPPSSPPTPVPPSVPPSVPPPVPRQTLRPMWEIMSTRALLSWRAAALTFLCGIGGYLLGLCWHSI